MKMTIAALVVSQFLLIWQIGKLSEEVDAVTASHSQIVCAKYSASATVCREFDRSLGKFK